MKRRSITLLAHPNSLRPNAGRPCFVTESGIERRVDEARGTGEGANYIPWLCCTDFSSSGYRRMVYSQKVGRIVHLLSELEWRAFLVAEFDPSVIDIRENFPLGRQRTREIAKRLGINHPSPYEDDIVMTTDLYLTIRTPAGPRHAAWYVKHERAAQKPRPQELRLIEREYHVEDSPSVQFVEVTENSFPRVLTENIKYVRGAIRPPTWLDKAVVDRADSTMRLKAQHEPLADVCEGTDSLLGLPCGTSLLLARHFIATRRWTVNMLHTIAPQEPVKWEIAS